MESPTTPLDRILSEHKRSYINVIHILNAPISERTELWHGMILNSSRKSHSSPTLLDVTLSDLEGQIQGQWYFIGNK